jgi:hypothetical protein
MYRQPKQNNNSDLMLYAGMGSQILVSLGLGVFAVYHADKLLKLRLPLLVWLLPFLILCLMIYKLIRETSKKKGNEHEKKI